MILIGAHRDTPKDPVLTQTQTNVRSDIRCKRFHFNHHETFPKQLHVKSNTFPPICQAMTIKYEDKNYFLVNLFMIRSYF